MLKLTRRGFLRGSVACATTLSGVKLGFSNDLVQRSLGGGNQNTLVYLFLRGGMDSLNLMMPISGQNRIEYESKRPNIMVPDSGTNAALNLDGQFGLHPQMSGLKELFDDGNLAIVQAAGMPAGLGSRSHFDSQEMYDLGTPGQLVPTSGGWLARHLSSAPNIPGSAQFTAAAASSAPPVSFAGNFDVLTLDGASSFHPNVGRYGNEHVDALNSMYSGMDPLDLSVQSAIETINLVESIDLTIPPAYDPFGGVADDLGLVAGLIKADLGLQVATVDWGGWDTHNTQGNAGGGGFANRMEDLSGAISAFYNDLTASGLENKVTIAVQTEFGRRVRENGNQGTDHGTAHCMLVCGGQIQGGQIYGQFPGIRDQDLYLNTDLQVTTDYRRVLSEILTSFMGNPNVDVVFPGYSGYTPMGLFPSDLVFSNSFE